MKYRARGLPLPTPVGPVLDDLERVLDGLLKLAYELVLEPLYSGLVLFMRPIMSTVHVYILGQVEDVSPL